ncbi:unnamed protein product [Brugia timori]|uniref:CMP/dCMP-type deaminase domain-containing protein n=1 Tax=Brugia timori TaxID=42155 RepID=A0A3P7YAN2_9BILA|nr:unnamed protein product [Brugia timori]
MVTMARFEEKPEKAKNVLVFEDATNGVYAAVAAGMHVVMVPDLTYMKIPDELQNKINLILRSLEDFKPESLCFHFSITSSLPLIRSSILIIPSEEEAIILDVPVNAIRYSYCIRYCDAEYILRSLMLQRSAVDVVLMSLEEKLNKEEVHFLNRAFEIAVDAVANNEVPVGCVFVFEGQEVAFGRNDVNRSKNPTYHAEMVALEMMKQWCTDNGRELEDVMRCTTLYVTLEPCIMCASALYHLHLKKILYGAANERFGGLLSVGTREKYGAKHFIEIMPNLNVSRAVKLLKEFYEKQNPFCPEEKRKIKKPKKSRSIDDTSDDVTVVDI